MCLAVNIVAVIVLYNNNNKKRRKKQQTSFIIQKLIFFTRISYKKSYIYSSNKKKIIIIFSPFDLIQNKKKLYSGTKLVSTARGNGKNPDNPSSAPESLFSFLFFLQLP